MRAWTGCGTAMSAPFIAGPARAMHTGPFPPFLTLLRAALVFHQHVAGRTVDVGRRIYAGALGARTPEDVAGLAPGRGCARVCGRRGVLITPAPPGLPARCWLGELPRSQVGGKLEPLRRPVHKAAGPTPGQSGNVWPGFRAPGPCGGTPLCVKPKNSSTHLMLAPLPSR